MLNRWVLLASADTTASSPFYLRILGCCTDELDLAHFCGLPFQFVDKLDGNRGRHGPERVETRSKAIGQVRLQFAKVGAIFWNNAESDKVWLMNRPKFVDLRKRFDADLEKKRRDRYGAAVRAFEIQDVFASTTNAFDQPERSATGAQPR